MSEVRNGGNVKRKQTAAAAARAYERKLPDEYFDNTAPVDMVRAAFRAGAKWAAPKQKRRASR